MSMSVGEKRQFDELRQQVEDLLSDFGDLTARFETLVDRIGFVVDGGPPPTPEGAKEGPQISVPCDHQWMHGPSGPAFCAKCGVEKDPATEKTLIMAGKASTEEEEPKPVQVDHVEPVEMHHEDRIGTVPGNEPDPPKPDTPTKRSARRKAKRGKAA